jgi:hypothetical protein
MRLLKENPALEREVNEIMKWVNEYDLKGDSGTKLKIN